MIKSQLIQLIAAKMNHLSEKSVEDGVNQILATMSQALEKGQRIEIRGFGAFTARQMPARIAHNPKTGEKVRVRSKSKVHFKPGRDLKKRLITSQETVAINDD